MRSPDTDSLHSILRKEAKWIFIMTMVTGLIMGLAGWQDGVIRAQKHIELCVEHQDNAECK